MGIPGSQNGGTVPYKAIFWGYIPLHRPYIGLIYGRYLQFRMVVYALVRILSMNFRMSAMSWNGLEGISNLKQIEVTKDQSSSSSHNISFELLPYFTQLIPKFSSIFPCFLIFPNFLGIFLPFLHPEISQFPAFGPFRCRGQEAVGALEAKGGRDSGHRTEVARGRTNGRSLDLSSVAVR